MATDQSEPSRSPRSPQVTLIGSGSVGSALAQRILEKNLADVVLLDIVDGRPQGLALDLMEASGLEDHDRHIVGTNDYADTAGSDIVIISAGLPRKPGMTRDDLAVTNAPIVANAIRQAIVYSPEALVIIITNPLDVMTHLAWQVSGLPVQRVMGMAAVLDSARFQRFIAWELGVSIRSVTTLVLGGHGDQMVPLPRYSTVNGIPITELLDAATVDRLVERTRNGGTEIVQLLKTGGAFYAPASSACRMVEAILYNQSSLLPVSAYLQGEYGLHDVFIGVPCRIGQFGIEQVVELSLTDAELELLQTSAMATRNSFDRLPPL
jgi:malate dehydrogenase